MIALFIMREKAMGAASDWEPYISALPEHIPQAAYFTREAFKHLQVRCSVVWCGVVWCTSPRKFEAVFYYCYGGMVCCVRGLLKRLPTN